MLESEPPLTRTQIGPGFFSACFWAFFDAKDDPDLFNKIVKRNCYSNRGMDLNQVYGLARLAK